MSVMDACAGPGFALPWNGKEEEVPLGGECDDCDVPFVIRDANGLEVLTIWENYGPGLQENHVLIGEWIIEAVAATPDMLEDDLTEGRRMRMRDEKIKKLYDALAAMVDRWEPDCDGQDRVMWENAVEAMRFAKSD